MTRRILVLTFLSAQKYAVSRCNEGGWLRVAVFRVEKNKNYTVMSNYHLKDKGLSLKSKGLLSVILSLPENWNYTTRGLAAISKEGVDSIGTALKELEKTGYLVRNKVRDARGRITNTEYIVYEYPRGSPDVDQSHTVYPDTENPDMDKPSLDNPAQLSINLSNPKSLNPQALSINQLNIDQSIDPIKQGTSSGDGMDQMNVYVIYQDIIKRNIEYDYLVEKYPYHRQEIDEMVALMLDVVCSSRKSFRVGGEEKAGELVRSQMLAVNGGHVEYVLECLDKNTTDIRNIKSYLLTAIYNAPSTIGSYYKAAVNRDLYGDK